MLAPVFRYIKFVSRWHWLIIVLAGLSLGYATIYTWRFQKRCGLRGEYYTNLEWAGTPALTQRNQIPFLKGQERENILSADVFSVKWMGWIIINKSGPYRFATESDDGSLLTIKGQLLVDNGGLHGKKRVSRVIELQKGIYPIEILYMQGGGYSVLRTLWTRPGEQEQRLPIYALRASLPKGFDCVIWPHVFMLSRSLTAIWFSLGVGLVGMGVFVFRHALRMVFASDAWWLIVGSIIAFATAYYSPIDDTKSDAHGTLLTAQAILEHHTIQLNAYPDIVPDDFPWQIDQKQGHYYYHYPIGTPLYVIPFVWIANHLGYDMAEWDEDTQVQNVLSALTVAVSFGLIMLLMRHFVNRFDSLLFACTFVFGSSFISTMGTALWNMNLAVIFLLLALLLIVHDEAIPFVHIQPYLLGFCAFSAYLCRPTAAIFVVWIGGYLCLKQRNRVLPFMMTLLILAGLFVGFSWMTYQQVLPDYYLSKQLGPRGDFWWAIYGHLLSPSRGILIYSPYLLLSAIGGIAFYKHLRRNVLFWMCLGWIICHLGVISRNAIWYGGGCFGTRMFTDVFPAFIVLTMLIWNAFERFSAPLFRRIGRWCLVICAALSIVIHTLQGAYNPATADWFRRIIWHEKLSANMYMFDWEFPQFLATPQALERRDTKYRIKLLQPFQLGAALFPDNEDTLLFVNWYHDDASEYGRFRLTKAPTAQCYFKIAAQGIQKHETLDVEITLSAYQKQRVVIQINRQKVGSLLLHDFSPTTHVFQIPATLLCFTHKGSERYNAIDFSVSDETGSSELLEPGERVPPGINFWRLRITRGN